MVDQLFLTNSLLQLASGIVALSISVTAFRYMRLVENDILRYLSFGFMLLGIGLIFGAALMLLLAFDIARVVDNFELIYVATVSYLLLQTLAYLSFAVGYARGAYSNAREELTSTLSLFPVMALPRLPRSYLLLGYHINSALQLVILILLAFVIFQGALIYSRTRGRFSLLVLSGFSLIFIAHAVMLASSLIPSAIVFTAGAIIQFFGFISLLVFLLNSGRVHAAAKN